MARPRIEIDASQFEKLCSIQCTEREIASYFSCSIDTIERWCKREYKASFADIYEEKRGLGKISLRRTQFRLAESNPSMAIFLGKQYLGQTDKQEVAVSRTDDDTIREMESYFADKQEEHS